MAMPVPLPPRMYAGRMTTGRPISSTTRRASSIVWAVADDGTSRPMPTMASLNFWRSSAVAMASALAPIISGVPGTPMMPASNSSIARFRPVWPPSVGRTASGRSCSMIRVACSRSRGST